MSEDRKKVTPEQLGILVEAIEQDPSLAGLKSRKSDKSEYLTKWQSLANKLNLVDCGAQKSISKWQQTWRDLKSNIRKKAAKTGNGMDLTDLELRVLKLDKQVPVVKEENNIKEIDISAIADVDPLSSEEECIEDDGSSEQKTAFSPDMITVYSNDDSKTVGRKRSVSDNQNTGTIKRQRVHLFPDPRITKLYDSYKLMLSQLELIVKKQHEFIVGQNRMLSILQHIQDNMNIILEKITAVEESLI